ncbi:MAG: mechanosensitive ion channel domain-containing protein [Verrucomicrobiota bacterium]
MDARIHSGWKRLVRGWEIISLVLVVVIFAGLVYVNELQNRTSSSPFSLTPLKPLDRSSPRSLLLGFLAGAEDVAEAYHRYRQHPGIVTFNGMVRANQRIVQALDASEIPPAERQYRSYELSIMLWDVLCRIDLPPVEEIPGAATPDPERPAPAPAPEAESPAGEAESKPPPLDFWTVPNTEITLAKIQDGVGSAHWVFSAGTVDRIPEFYQLTRHLGYQRPMDLGDDPGNLQKVIGGWMIPPHVTESMPFWLQAKVLGQAVWKWLATFLLMASSLLIAIGVYSWASRTQSRNRIWSYFRRLATPLSVLVLLWAVYYLSLYQITTRGGIGQLLSYTLPTVAYYLALAWVAWLVANFISELVISSPTISKHGTDRHLVRLGFRVAGIVVVVVIFFQLGNAMDVPLYGLVAGAGVGTLAVALAAQNTLENFIGSLNLFADRPIRAGDFFSYNGEVGTVEEIGLRSTRIRGLNRTVSTIPNAQLSKMTIINYTKRDRMLLRHCLTLRLETSPDQLRHVIIGLRELLIAHPKVAEDPLRARLLRVSESGLDVEIFAYVTTSDWNEFLAVQEDVLLRMLDVVAASGSGFAYPSNTTYLARDTGIDRKAGRAAEAAVARWREENQLQFPEHQAPAREALQDSLPYPPKGAPIEPPRENGA